MSSAENELDFTRKGWGFTDAENDTRPVWLSDDLCGLIYTALAYAYPKDIDKADTFWKAWKAAPADPAEAVERGILDTFPDLKGVRISLSIDHSERAATACARRVLAALGGPKGTR